MAAWAFLNTEFMPASEAGLHSSDLAIQRGYAVFDFFKFVEGRPVYLARHLDRFFRSAAILRLLPALDQPQLKTVIHELIHRNSVPDGGIRLTLTGGYSNDGFTLLRPNLLITQHTYDPPSPELRERGIRLSAFQHQRQLPEAKTTDYLMAIWARPTLQETGADELLYCRGQHISECPRSNFFLVTQDHTLVTPAEGILKGVTRQQVLQLAALDFKVEERDVRLEEIPTASEAFITSTTKGILPVLQIDRTKLGKNRPVTNRLISLLDQHQQQYLRSVAEEG